MMPMGLDAAIKKRTSGEFKMEVITPLPILIILEKEKSTYLNINKKLCLMICACCNPY